MPGKKFAQCLGLVLLLVPLSACTAPATDATEKEDRRKGSDAVFVEPLDATTGTPPAAGRSAIAGRVTDDAGFALDEAHVALLDTDNATKTDKQGRFRFDDLVPGAYRLRVDRSGYRASEADVPALDGNVTRINITMLPVSDAGAGYRPHVHDYWAGQSEITVADADIDWHEPPQRSEPYAGLSRAYSMATHIAAPNACLDTEGRVLPRNPPIWFADPAQLVIPGTGEIRIRLSWTPDDYTGDELYIAWHPANNTNISITGPIANGAEATIGAEPATWDSGHQSFTLWRFWICLRDQHFDLARDQSKSVLGPLHATIVLQRGSEELQLEPPHPTFWKDADRLDLAENLSRRVSPTLVYTYNHHAGNPEFTWGLPDGEIVPPGTGSLHVRLEWDYAEPRENRPMSLTYRAANEHPSARDPGMMAKASPTSSEESFREYVIDLEPKQTDAFYQTRSNWLFMFNYEGEEAEALFTNPCACEIKVRLSVQAERDLGQSDIA